MAFTIDRLLDLGRVGAAVPSPDGTWVAVPVSRLDAEEQKYTTELWRVPLDGGAPVQLTRGKHRDRAPSFRRDGALGFLSDRPTDGDGKEDRRDQVWILRATGGEPFPLTDEPLGVLAFQFAADGDALCVLAEVLPGVPHDEQRARAKDLAKKGPTDLHYTHTPVRHWDQWLGRAAPHVIAYDAQGKGRRDLTPDADRQYRGDVSFDVSRDGTRAVVTEASLADDRLLDTYPRVFDLKTGASRVLARKPRTNGESPVFSPSGRTVALSRNTRSPEAHGPRELTLADVEGGEVRVLCKHFDGWPVPQAFLDETHLVASADAEGHVPVYVVDTAKDTITRVTAESAGGTHEGLAVTRQGHVVGVRHTLLQPPEPFTLEPEEGAEPRLLARLSGFDPKDAGSMVVSRFDVTSTDGARVDSYLLRPATPAKVVPLLWVHGGPIHQWGDVWHWRWNALVFADAGYAVVLPNPRGSTGYGQAFVEGIWKNSWGAQCYDDLMCVTDAVVKRPDLDGARIAAMGGSFGGYMMNWIGGHTDRFRALVTHASIFHFEAMFGASDYGTWFNVELGTSPWVDRAQFEKHSPHRFVGAWKTPTLVLHGEKDYRVPISEALILFEWLQAHRVPSELVVFPDENHWILRPENARAWYGHVLRFLGEHVAA